MVLQLDIKDLMGLNLDKLEKSTRVLVLLERRNFMKIEGNKVIKVYSIDVKNGTVEFPNGIEEISEYAFAGLKELTRIIIPNSIYEVGEFAFWCCQNLTGCIFKNPDCKIGKFCFRGCTKLKTIVLPKKLIELPDMIFEDCTNLQSIKVPDTISYISYYDFDDCLDLKRIRWRGHVYSYEDLLEYGSFSK